MTDSSVAGAADDPRIRAIGRALSRHSPSSIDPSAEGPGAAGAAGSPLIASVALVVRPGIEDLEVLLIHRAAYEGDPWSGHIALPGGRRAATDRTIADTAARETMEEVGIDLAAHGTPLGRLDDVAPRAGSPLVAVTPFVFAVPADLGITLNHEVASAMWVPTRHLVDPASAIEHLHTLATGERLSFPAIGYQEFVIWGLTHRILSQFFELTRDEG